MRGSIEGCARAVAHTHASRFGSVLRYSATLIVLAVLVAGSAVRAEAAQPTATEDGKLKIDYAGRQRMLSQQIVKSACFAAFGLARVERLAEIENARNMFAAALAGLRNGSEPLRLLPETDQTVLAALADVERQWPAFTAAIEDYAASKSAADTTTALSTMSERAGPLLLDSDLVTQVLEERHLDGQIIAPDLASAINVAGRQRMLSQKLAKELCLFARGVAPVAMSAQLVGTIALFDSSHTQLTTRLSSLKLPTETKSEIARRLGDVGQQWLAFKARLALIKAKPKPEVDDIAWTLAFEAPFRQSLDAIVKLYGDRK